MRRCIIFSQDALIAVPMHSADAHSREPRAASAGTAVGLGAAEGAMLDLDPDGQGRVEATRAGSPSGAAMVAEVARGGGGIWYSDIPSPNIVPYLAYYGHLVSHYGGPWCSPISWWCDKKL